MLDALHVAWLWLHQFHHATLYLTLGWITYLVWLGGWIVLQKRAPAATLGWLLALAALPYVGFLVYYVLGPQRITRQRMRRARARVALPALDGEVAAAELHELARLAQATTGLPVTTATTVRLLVDGGAM